MIFRFRGRKATITGLATGGSYVLSNSMDNTLQGSDFRPYVSMAHCIKVLPVHQHNFKKNLLRCAKVATSNVTLSIMR